MAGRCWDSQGVTTHSQSPISRVCRRRSTRGCGTYERIGPCVNVSSSTSLQDQQAGNLESPRGTKNT